MNINSLGQQILVSSCEECEDHCITTKNSSKGDWIGCACQIQYLISITTKYQKLNCCRKHDMYVLHANFNILFPFLVQAGMSRI